MPATAQRNLYATAPAPVVDPVAWMYVRLLDAVEREASRGQRVVLLAEMATVAAQLDIPGAPQLAWRQTSVLLGQLAAAEGGNLVPGGPDEDAWAEVASATTQDQFDEAVMQLLDALGGSTPLPALERLSAAAQACAGHRPAVAAA